MALANKLFIADDVTAGHLIFLDETFISPGQGVYLVYPNTESSDPRLLAFGDWFKEEIEQF